MMPGALDDVPVGTIVEALPEGPGFPMLQGCQFRPAEGKAASYYTYAGIVEHVVDGDTLWVDIECGFGIWTEQKLRLRGIDAPEMDTAEGREAKDFVVRAIGRGRSSIAPKGASTSFKATVGRAGGRGQMEVAVTTTRPDKYDRYLVDVFYDERLTGEAQDGRGGDAGSRAAEVLRTGAFLNRRLVEEGFASRYRGKVPG